MKVLVRGVVQGVGFRPTVYRIATSMGLNGWVQNNGADVIIAIDRDAEEFVRRLRAELPPLARLDSVEIVDEEVVAEGFRIVPSSSGQRGVGIPNDSAICDDCLREMFTPGQRRYLYPFTNCTNCGARFTIIEDMPYDRAETSMRDFPMCPDCRNEYDDPMARRFHHQTISCPRCGPEYYLLDRNGRRIDVDDPMAFFAEQMERGRSAWPRAGGMHLLFAARGPISGMVPPRPEAFAVMNDMDAVRRYGRPDEHEVELLTSPHRPVVLVPRTDEPVNEMISPGLGNVGLFLPYTEMQHILFRHLKSDALVMTSANTPGEPMVLRDSDALDLNAELYLLHNREILNRCDDSVVRSFGRNTFFLRKSRGHIPSPIEVRLKGQAVGVGAQENLTGAVIKTGGCSRPST